MPPSSFLTKAEEDEIANLLGKNHDPHEVVTLIDRLLEFAVARGASDIHIEPMRENLLVRYRLDGILYDATALPKSLHETLMARIKILAELKIDERRVPQDGRFSGSFAGKKVDFRVSIIPLIFGEKAALRVLAQEARELTLEELGFGQDARRVIEANLRKPYGMVLVCGPNGSGKTTTLYSLLQSLMRERNVTANLNTIEDPVEYAMDRVNQIQINPSAGLTFNTALRGLLRQDTDIIMVGEIRDRETAEAATQASLTGRMLLSSLHTRDAVGAIIRLLEIGIEPYLVASAATVAIAQRLVRLICLSCVSSYTLDEKTYQELEERYGLSRVLDAIEKRSPHLAPIARPLRLFRGAGCEACRHTGYRGRTAIFEVFEVSDAVRERIQQRSSSALLRDQALTEGMVTMFQDGFEKALSGRTTLEEVLKVTLE